MTTTLQPKQKRDKVASKAKLLQAAIDVFSRRGYDATTTKEVAATAGISEALIQRYFGGKAGLLLEIVKSYENKCQADPQSTCPPPLAASLEEDFCLYFNYHFNACQEEEKLIRVILSRAIVDPEVAEHFRKNIFERRIPKLVERLKQFQQQGLLGAGENLEAIALILVSMGFELGFLNQRVMGMDKTRLQQAAEQFSRIFAAGLSNK